MDPSKLQETLKEDQTLKTCLNLRPARKCGRCNTNDVIAEMEKRKQSGS
jgi:hypothetical protein